jgi:histidinol-phosphate aminotransferase
VAGKGYTEISRRYGIKPEDIVKLGSNENPYGPSPEAIRAMQEVSPERYPEPEDLITSLSSYTSCPEEMVVIGAGMDGVMDTLTRLFLERGDRTLIHTPTFSYYEILTTLAGATPVFAKRGPEFQISTEVPDGTKMVFLCSPNNPTGNVTSEDEVRAVLESTDAIVFLDEAYVEFANHSLLDLAKEYDNLVVGRTLSKAFGLAGMRLGYAVAPEWIAQEYRKVAPPFFGITCASVAAGVAALNDLDYMRTSVSRIKSERERLHKEIGSHPSQANFLYIQTEETSDLVTEHFLSRGIIIRDCRSFRGAGEHHVRITVGTPEQNDLFLKAFREICR